MRRDMFHGMETEPRYMSVLQFAERTGLPVGWLRRELREGNLPSIRAGRRRLVAVNDADAALAARATPTGQAVAR